MAKSTDKITMKPASDFFTFKNSEVRKGFVYGETDEFSYNVTKDPVHVNDLNATILQLMGIDHEKFTVKFQGLAQRLTGVEGAKSIPQLIA